MPTFKTGKIPTEILLRNVFRYKSVRDRKVILNSSIGEDAAIVALGKNVLVLLARPRMSDGLLFTSTPTTWHVEVPDGFSVICC